jgi:hypothetical protein
MVKTFKEPLEKRRETRPVKEQKSGIEVGLVNKKHVMW